MKRRLNYEFQSDKKPTRNYRRIVFTNLQTDIWKEVWMMRTEGVEEEQDGFENIKEAFANLKL